MHNITKFSWLALGAAIITACGSSNDDVTLPEIPNATPILTNPTFAFGGTISVASPTAATVLELGLTENVFSDIILAAADGNSDEVVFSVTQPAGQDIGIELGVSFNQIPQLTEQVLMLALPIVGEDEEPVEFSFTVSATDGEFSVSEDFNVIVTPPPAFAPGVFDGSVTTAPDLEATEIVSIIPIDGSSFTAFYHEDTEFNGGPIADGELGEANNTFQQDFASLDDPEFSVGPIEGSLISTELDLTVNPGPIDPPPNVGGSENVTLFSPNIATFVGAVENDTLFRPVFHHFSSNFSAAFDTQFSSELQLFTGSFAEGVVPVDSGINEIFQEIELNGGETFIANPTADSFAPISSDSLLSFDFRGFQVFGAAIDPETPEEGLDDINTADQDSISVTAFITSGTGITSPIIEGLFADGSVIVDFFDPTDPPMPGAFLSINNASVQGAAFGNSEAGGGFVAFLSSLANTLHMQFVGLDSVPGDVVLLDDTVGNEMNNISVTTLSTGQVMIAWATLADPADGETFNPIDPDTVASSRIVARVFNDDGQPATEEFSIGDPAVTAIDPRIISTSDGRAVVSWFVPGEGPFLDGDEVVNTLAAQIIDIPAEGVTTATGSNIAFVPDGRIDSLPNGVGAELEDGSFVLSHSNFGLSFLTEDDAGVISFEGAPEPDGT